MRKILNQAERLEKEYDWLGAAELYEKTLNELPKDDFSKMGQIHERLGYAYYRAAFQAESEDEFRGRLQKALPSYERARELHRRSSKSAKTSSILRCDAILAYMGYWLAADASEKKKMLHECWRFTEDSLRSSKGSGKTKEYGETYNQISASALLEFCFELSIKGWLKGER